MTQQDAVDILKTGANVFLTGEPGSGKSYTVNQYVAWLRSHGIEPAITASTGIAATHIGGMTIHSWAGIGIREQLSQSDLKKIAENEYVTKRIRWAKVLIIDEVSMLAADTLTMVDQVCRAVKELSQPFGGMQVVLVGDFFQLPPIVKRTPVIDNQSALEFSEPPSPYAYNASVWEAAEMVVCYLSEQHRQDDGDFLQILSAIRANAVTEIHWAHLHGRRVSSVKGLENLTKLYAHNLDVDTVNDRALSLIDAKAHAYGMSSYGGPANLVAALKKGCLSPESLVLKLGAAVMFTKNNPKEGFVNGTLGAVTDFHKSGSPIVTTTTGAVITVEPMEWVVEENGRVRAGITQVPLRLAWAMTIHKSQGMSLDQAVMDLSAVFEYGQGYVALSRVRRLSGLHLLGLSERVFQVHPEILEKDAAFHRSSDQASTDIQAMTATDLRQRHDQFIRACGGSLEATTRKVKKPKTLTTGGKVDTYAVTLELWRAGKDLEGIAAARDLTTGTIIGHLEKLVGLEKITPADVSRVVPSSLRPHLPTIQAAFRELGGETLSPIFSKLGGRYSFDELKLARIVLPAIE